MSQTRYEWTLVDFAIWTAGAVTVPIYETSSAEQVAVDPQRLRRRRAVRRDRRAPRAVVDEVRDDLPRRSTTSGGSTTAALDELVAAGTGVADDELEQRRTHAQPGRAWRRSSTPRARPAGPRAAS